MNETTQPKPTPEAKQDGGKLIFFEFIVLVAGIQSLTALSIDAMLPAFPDIGRDLNVSPANDVQLVIMVMFLGMALGQLLYGPLADSLGRRRPIMLGFVIYLSGSVVCLFSGTLTMLLLGRFLQGFGSAAFRIVTVAIIRDRFEGPTMARVMSFVMTIFILVPVVAPAIGQGVLWLAGWRAIFAMFLVNGLLLLLWFLMRMHETLPLEKRVPLSFTRSLNAAREVFRIRAALGYTLCIGLMFGPFMAYLSTAQQLFADVFDRGEELPVFFAILALSFGAASLTNASLVMKFGMYSLSLWSACTFTGVALLSWVALQTVLPEPPLWGFMACLMLTFFCQGLMFGNLNAMAMQPLGHIAGVGATMVGALSMLVSLPAAYVIAQAFDGTVLPLVTGYAVFGVAVVATMLWTKRGICRRPVTQASAGSSSVES